LAGRPFVWVDELYANPLRVDHVNKKVSDGAGGIIEIQVNMPVWLEPVAGGDSSPDKAFTLALWLVDRWVHAFPSAFFPLVLHICGSQTASADLPLLAARIEKLKTDFGPTIVANAFISWQGASDHHLFPDGDLRILEPTAKLLFSMSSRLPESMRGRAGQLGYSLTEQSRAFVQNGGIRDFIDMLPMDSF